MCKQPFDAALLRTVGNARICEGCDTKFDDSIATIVEFVFSFGWATILVLVPMPHWLRAILCVLTLIVSTFGIVRAVRGRKKAQLMESVGLFALAVAQLIAPSL